MKKWIALFGIAFALTSFAENGSVEKRRLGSIRASENVVTDVKGFVDTGDVQRVINENVRTNYLASYEQMQKKLSLPDPSSFGTNFFPLTDGKGGVEWTWYGGGGGGGSLGKVTQVQDTSNKWHNVRSFWDGTKQVLVIDPNEAEHVEMTVQQELTRASNAEYRLSTNINNEVVARIYADENLQDQINSISTLGRFISTWNTETGKPSTEPSVERLYYKSGDYYIIGSVSTKSPPENLIPSGSYRDRRSTSTCMTNETIYVNDVFRYAGDGQWTRVIMKDVSIMWQQITGEPTNNFKLVSAITNLSYYVTTNTVTKKYVEDLGIQSCDTNAVQWIINRNIQTNNVAGYSFTTNLVAYAISTNNPAFSNAVLSVGLNIDTNSVAVLNEIAATFGGFPIAGTATTVGGLLAALAAAIAWLRKNKVDKSESGTGEGDLPVLSVKEDVTEYELIELVRKMRAKMVKE